MRKNIYIILCLIVSSCTNNDILTKYGEQRMLNNFKSSFNDSIWKGLPERVDRRISVLDAYYPAALEFNVNYYGIFILENFEDNSGKAIIRKNSQSDATLLKVDNIKSQGSISMFSFKGKNNDITSSNISIIPDFQEKYSPLKDYINTDKWKVSIIDTYFGNILDNDGLKYSNSTNKHGISKGFFINSRADSIIYWIIGW